MLNKEEKAVMGTGVGLAINDLDMIKSEDEGAFTFDINEPLQISGQNNCSTSMLFKIGLRI